MGGSGDGWEASPWDDEGEACEARETPDDEPDWLADPELHEPARGDGGDAALQGVAWEEEL